MKNQGITGRNQQREKEMLNRMGGLEINNICKTFSGFTAVNDVNLNIGSGELFFLLGPSGCGKTTLLRIIAGFTAPDSGTITFNGADLLATPVEKRNIGMVFQNYSLWPHMTVLDNVAYGLKMRKAGGNIMERARAALAMVDMQGLEERKPGALSGGQQQRVALARAIVYEPGLLLLDEPLSNLDAKLRKDMRAGIRRLHERLGITMIYVTHDQEEAASMADRIALMRNGTVIQTGTPVDLYRYPDTGFAAEFFGRANIFKGILASVDNGRAVVQWGQYRLETVVSSRDVPVAGSGVTVVIRPENLVFVPNGPNVLTGLCVSHEFSGAVINSVVDVNGEHYTVMSVSSQSVPEQGAQVSIAFRPCDARCIFEPAVKVQNEIP
jgi:ABC-type Fe3+/spermidine/putrescine transport system ATPase subunit